MRPNSGEVQESAEKGALAKVIKHKGKDRQLDKTIIIKNTPEAFRFYVAALRACALRITCEGE